MNKQQILSISKEVKTSDRLREVADKIYRLDDNSFLSQYYHVFNGLPMPAKKEIAEIFRREANKIDPYVDESE